LILLSYYYYYLSSYLSLSIICTFISLFFCDFPVFFGIFFLLWKLPIVVAITAVALRGFANVSCLELLHSKLFLEESFQQLPQEFAEVSFKSCKRPAVDFLPNLLRQSFAKCFTVHVLAKALQSCAEFQECCCCSSELHHLLLPLLVVLHLKLLFSGEAHC
jgi:hypothetical protein